MSIKRGAIAVVVNIGISALTLNGGVANAYPQAPPSCPPGQTCPSGPGGSGGQSGGGNEAPKSQGPETPAPRSQAPETQAPKSQITEAPT